MSRVAELEQLFPLNRRDHRAFVSAFIQAVHEVTGRTYSPLVYRRILNAFAPCRTPSTTTIALEKARFVDELARRQVASIQGPSGERSEDQLDQGRLLGAIAQLLGRSSAGDAYLQKQSEFLLRQLSATQNDLADAKTLAAELAAEAVALRKQAVADKTEIANLHESRRAIAQEIARLASAVEDARRFALLAIDEARGETRAWKERWQHTENQLKEQCATTEIFRRLAYRDGLEVPPAAPNMSRNG